MQFPGAARARKKFDRAVEEAALAGRTSVHVRVATTKGERDLDLKIHRLEPVAWWTFAGGLFFSAALYAIAGLVALWVSRAALAKSFGAFALSSSLFLFTLFDFHTSRNLVPLFYLGFALLPVGLVMVPLRLPDDVRSYGAYPGWSARLTFWHWGVPAR